MAPVAGLQLDFGLVIHFPLQLSPLRHDSFTPSLFKAVRGEDNSTLPRTVGQRSLHLYLPERLLV